MENGNVRRKASHSDVDALRALLKSTNAKLVLPHDELYLTSISRWSTAAAKPAGVVVVPTCAEEVSIAVKSASCQHLDLAIKGGGHSTAGTSSTDGGLLIDLHGEMRQVTVLPEQKILMVGGGANWGDVDNASSKHGLAAVGGTVADTGVGGLTLGGGYGMVDWEASEHENEELFWALRGAGQNFGVVTEYVFRAHEQGDVWGGMLVFPPIQEPLEKLVDALNDLYTPDEAGKTKSLGRAGSGLAIARPPPTFDNIMVMVPIVFFGREDEGKKAFSKFFDAGPVASTLTMMPYPQANQIMAIPYGAFRVSMKGAAFQTPVRSPFVGDLLQSYTKFTAASPDRVGSMIFFEVYEPSQVMASSVGSFANRGRHFNAMIAPVWTDASKDAENRKWARDVSEMFKKELEKAGAETGNGVEGGVGV